MSKQVDTDIKTTRVLFTEILSDDDVLSLTSEELSVLPSSIKSEIMLRRQNLVKAVRLGERVRFLEQKLSSHPKYTQQFNEGDELR